MSFSARFAASRIPIPPRSPRCNRSALDEIKRRIGQNPQSFTYWLRHYLEHHLADIARHAGKAARSRKQR